MTSGSRSTRSTRCCQGFRRDGALPRRPKTRTTWLPWVALVALAASVGVWEARRPATDQENPLANARFSRFTDWEGTEEGAEISPDGKFVAFLADRDGQFDLWVSQVGTGRFSQPHARHSAAERASGSILRTLGFSGDGGGDLVHSGGRLEARRSAHAPDGGTPRPFLGQGADRTVLVSRRHPPRLFQRTAAAIPSFVADRTGADARQILAPETRGCCTTTIRSGHRTASGSTSSHGPEPTEEMDVWRVRPSGGSPERLTDAARGREFPGAARPAHAALRRARGGPVGTVAVVARCRDAR